MGYISKKDRKIKISLKEDVMREGFDERDEPTLTNIDDYKGVHSDEKRKIIKLVIISGLIVGSMFALARWYFWDKGEPELDIKKSETIKHY